MATLEASSTVYQIGESAGQIWTLLDTAGPQKITHVVKEIDAPRDLVMQALGWLAREEKITIEEQTRSRVVSLVG
ncbi:MAG: winged helix-turn-helix domain-containing protein [Pirellulales bacterium]|nr:winged helix-turn-helix domain-containing protein [Pirellulales bacterium]